MNGIASKLHRIRTLHLFAGAGGGILADLLLGHQPVCAVEIDPYCQQVLSARQKDNHLPWFPIFDDVQKFDGKPWTGIVDLIAGGFPCQDISSAGKGAGIEGERSGMWVEMARIIGEVRPRFAFVENSPMLTSRGLGRVLGDLAEMGYDAEWGVLGAGDTGAPHQRDRIWILAYAAVSDDKASASASGLGGWSQRKSGRGCGAGRVGQVANANVCGHDRKKKSSLHQAQNGLEVSNHASDGSCERNAWRAEPNVGRVAHGVAARVDRLKAIGNGQVPQCAAEAFRELHRRLSK